MDVHHSEALSAQAGILPAQLDQLTREPDMIAHLPVACVETSPMEQQVLMILEIVGPLFVLQELLAHEQHRNTRRGEANAGRHARTAATKPGAGVSEMAEARDPQLTAMFDDVMVLGSLHKPPVLSETFRPQAPGQPSHVERPFIRLAGVADYVANGEAQPIGERGVKARSEEHTSELQSLAYLVCRLLLEKKKT